MSEQQKEMAGWLGSKKKAGPCGRPALFINNPGITELQLGRYRFGDFQ